MDHIAIPLQKNALCHIREALRQGQDPNIDPMWHLSQEIEQAIFQWAREQQPPNKKRRAYCQKLRSTVFNLGNIERNPQLNDQVVNQEISPYSLVRMTPHELFPKLREQHFKDKEAREKWEREFAERQKQEETSCLFPCRKCKSTNTTYIQFQTRSADEPLTNFHTCHGCGVHWRS